MEKVQVNVDIYVFCFFLANLNKVWDIVTGVSKSLDLLSI